MQKLQAKFKNTPRNTSLVPCSVSSGLNRDQSPSDQDKVLTCNNSEENHQQHRAGSDLRVLNIVYVLNKRGKPLMPTCQSRARRLLRSNKAVVVKRFPFTIRMNVATGESKQEIVLGVDAGYKNVGVSAVSSVGGKQELFGGEMLLRDDIVELLSERRMYRRSRRSRHHWYREPRFNNRGKSSDWLPPSIQHKVDSHIRIVEKICKLLPITRIAIETAKFDIQKINNPEVVGNDYQNGVQKNFWNTREYVLYRDSHTCQHCKKTGLVLNVHHIVTRQTGGNRPDNLVTLCEKCHDKYHQGKIKLSIKIKNNYKPETCMSIIRSRIVGKLKERFTGEMVRETFGYITKANRIAAGISKSHVNDAFVIAQVAQVAQGSVQKTIDRIDRCGAYQVKNKRRNNRCLQTNRNGFAPSIRRKRYKIQPMDIIRINNTSYVAKGIFNKGDYVRVTDNSNKVFNFKCSLVDSYFNRGTLMWN